IPPALRLDQLKPLHVQRWIDSFPELSAGTKRNYCRAVMRAMRWAEEQGYVDRSPLAYFRKPPAGRKEQVVTPAEFSKVVELTAGLGFPTPPTAASSGSRRSWASSTRSMRCATPG